MKTSWQLSHLVENSWLPLGMSGMSFVAMLNIILWFKLGFNQLSSAFVLLGMSILSFIWFRDVSRESSFQGNHSLLVQSALKWGLVWFLFSEVWFFFSVFWGFFHMSMAPASSGYSWPLLGLSVIPPFQVPLLNTVVLLMSGLTATLGHQEVLSGLKSLWIPMSVMLGAYFLTLQSMEYVASSFSMASGVYGSVFFFGTGFHGVHVCLGAAMLAISATRMNLSLITAHHHFSLEFSLWYWHFVDVIWLFLFFWIYAWGS